MRRIGVFICHCGTNIAGEIDVERLVEVIRCYPGVAHATSYPYMCSEPGQKLIRQAIAEHGLEGVIVAACSPAMHETTFRRVVAAAGLNPHQFESANIREQCSWVHRHDVERATLKAEDIIKAMVEKMGRNQPLAPITMSLTRRALVIGGGIAGLQAALDIAAAGYPVILVEREATLGGRMAQLSGTYLNFEAVPALLASKIEEVTHHPHIQVLTQAQVEEVNGYVGNFTVAVESTQVDKDTSFTFEVGAIVVATGYDLYPQADLPEYGAGRYADVIDELEFEAMLSPTGPTGGRICRPSDGAVPREVVFVQCAGSRDPERGVPYCSKVCCMVTAKQAMMYRQQVPEGQAYVFYTDIRSMGKGYDEFVQRAMEEYGVLYLRGKVSRVFPQDGKVMVWGADTLSGMTVEVPADLVVLATALVPRAGAGELAKKLRIATDEHGFYNEAHPKLRPVESSTAGIFLAGAGQAPKDIPETVAQASGAAAKVLSLFAQQKLIHDPVVAAVDPELCSGCGICVETCPYEAREVHPVWNIAVVKEILCQGCGVCVVACPNKASQLRNYTPAQLMAMIDAVV
ncbi:MAG: CoB--CoM heterodisulfide reductase iron-sulfur subunit A family protein [Anaerolineae bacterium]